MDQNRNSFFRSIKYFGITVLFMFTAPVVIYQAFKNQEHPFYIPVLVLGLALGVVAIGLGFYSVKLLIDVIFNRSRK